VDLSLGDALWGALALMLLFEGLLPLINPRGWRSVFARVLQMTDGQIRFIGLLSVAIGLMLLWSWR
jgi:uncharacterized protein YjeT (DUF2065 family)